MALETPAYVISAANHSAALFRQAYLSLFQGTGIVPGGFVVAQRGAGANMSVDVPAGLLWAPGTQGGTQGMNPNLTAQTAYTGPTATFTNQGNYGAYNDGTTNLAISTADPSNPRIDLVVATVQDAIYGGSFNQAILQIVTGNPASAPAAPTVPASSLVIAQIAVAAGATSIVNANITYKAPTMALLGSLTLLAKSGDFTARNGDMIVMTGSHTVTLPSPLAPNQRVGVLSANGTGAAPCTVSTPTGNILGLGVAASATSVLLGSTGAQVILQSDGTNWYIVDGAQDSGWVTYNPQNSWTAGSPAPAYRLTANVLRLRGAYGAFGASGSTITTLPAGYRPSTAQILSPYSQTGSTIVDALMNVSTGGVIAMSYTGTLGAATQDGLTFTVD